MKTLSNASRSRFAFLSALALTGFAALSGCNLVGNVGLDKDGLNASLEFTLRADGFVQETLDSMSTIAEASATPVATATYTDVGPVTVGVLDALPPDSDVVFAVDNTGSMGWAIEQVKTDVVEAMKKNPNRRYGVVVYRDRGDSFVKKTLSPLPDGLDAAVAAIESMEANEGNDFPESVAVGINEALDQPWDMAKERHIILIGDAPDHEYPDEATPMDQVLARSQTMGVTIHAVGVPCNDVCKTEIGAK